MPFRASVLSESQLQGNPFAVWRDIRRQIYIGGIPFMKYILCNHRIKPVCSLSTEYSESGTCHNICKPVTVVIHPQEAGSGCDCISGDTYPWRYIPIFAAQYLGAGKSSRSMSRRERVACASVGTFDFCQCFHSIDRQPCK